MLPRERIRTLGLSALTEPELLAVLLGTGPVSHNNLGAITLAETLLAELGDLNSVINAPWPVLERVSGMGTVKSCRIAAVGELLRRTRRPLSKTVLANAEDVFLLFSELTVLDREELWVALMTHRNELVLKSQVCAGSSNYCTTTPREVIRLAVKYNSMRLIIAHNHPAGDPQPSEEDVRFTHSIGLAAQTVGIRLLDHLIVGSDNRFFSFAREGFIEPLSHTTDLRLSGDIR